MGLFLCEPPAPRKPHHGLWFCRSGGSSHRVLSPSGFAPTGEAWARRLPAWPLSHCFPRWAGLKAAWQASATQANSQRAEKPSVCHMDQDMAPEQARQAGSGEGEQASQHGRPGAYGPGPAHVRNGRWSGRVRPIRAGTATGRQEGCQRGWNPPHSHRKVRVQNRDPTAQGTHLSWLPGKGGNPVPGTHGMPTVPGCRAPHQKTKSTRQWEQDRGTHTSVEKQGQREQQWEGHRQWRQ